MKKLKDLFNKITGNTGDTLPTGYKSASRADIIRERKSQKKLHKKANPKQQKKKAGRNVSQHRYPLLAHLLEHDK